MNKSLALMLLLVCAGPAASPVHAETPADAKTTPAKSGRVKWQTTYKSALKAATEQKKPVLVLFTGTDWCPHCKVLEKSLITTKEFKEWAAANAILYKAEAKGGPMGLSPQDQKLIAELKGTGFPSIFLVNSEGKLIGKVITRRDMSTGQYIQQLDALLKSTP